MTPQLEGLKAMLAANSVWQDEVASSNSIGTDSAEDRIHLFASFESVHPYPRIEISNGGWDYNFHMGNCLTKIRIQASIDLIRPMPDPESPTATEEQYLEVCGVLEGLIKELSETSCASGAPLAQLSCSVIDGPHYDAAEERELSDGENRFICWWANFTVETP